MSFADRPFTEIPFAVVDIETTGLVPGLDRIVEIAVVCLGAGKRPRLLLDSLIDPGRPMAATAIHGLRLEDVSGAPPISALSPSLRSLFANRVVVAHNAGFDLRFLSSELGADLEPPVLCTLELLAALDSGRRYSLVDACRRLEVELGTAHAAAADALATAHLLERLLSVARAQNLRTLGQLAERRRQLETSLRLPLPPPPILVQLDHLETKPRSKPLASRPRTPTRRYLDAVLAVVSDLQVDIEEVKKVRRERDELGLPEEVVRAVHARVFQSMLDRYTEEIAIDDIEKEHLRRLFLCLSALGWAPGE